MLGRAAASNASSKAQYLLLTAAATLLQQNTGFPVEPAVLPAQEDIQHQSLTD